jgi:hypothetical protein
VLLLRNSPLTPQAIGGLSFVLASGSQR